MIDWFNKKLDGQSLSRRYRGDFWTEREFWEEERLSHGQMSRKLDGEHGVKVTEPHERTQIKNMG